jgi:hypothetical protein
LLIWLSPALAPQHQPISTRLAPLHALGSPAGDLGRGPGVADAILAPRARGLGPLHAVEAVQNRVLGRRPEDPVEPLVVIPIAFDPTAVFDLVVCVVYVEYEI